LRSVGVSKISVILLAFATAAVAVSASQVASMGESEQGVMSVTDRPPLAATAPEAIKDAFGKLPLFFEPNRGQADEEVEFLSRGPGHELFLTSTGAVLSLQKPHDENSAAVLGMGLEGANSESRVTGVGELDGKINYIKGNDRAEWRTNVPTYGGVRYEGVYPGIDLLYHGRQGALEYDFELAPGRTPARSRSTSGALAPSSSTPPAISYSTLPQGK
jgi:hypothetical protein